MVDLWLVIPTGARTQYLQDIFKECDIEPSKRILVRTLPDEDIDNAINLQYQGEFNIHKWWNTGTQTGTLDSTITGGGTGVSVVDNPVIFNAGSFPAVGSPTLQDGSPNPYHAPAVTPTTWEFAPYGTAGAALQPNGQQTFNQATESLGLTPEQNQAIRDLLTQQQQASGLGNPNPTDASWITKSVTLETGKVYTMSWNYIGTDYVPFNDGSITSLVYQGSGTAPSVTVNSSGCFSIKRVNLALGLQAIIKKTKGIKYFIRRFLLA